MSRLLSIVASRGETKGLWVNIALVFLGSVFLALMAQLSVPLPFTPVPVSMQTFGVFILAGTLGYQRAMWSICAYIAEGTLGLPVFAGGISNPLWFMGPKAGYIVGFVAATFLISRLLDAYRPMGFFSLVLTFVAGEAIILVLGSLWLALFVGASQAIAMGILPFVVGGAMKIIAAASFLQGISLVKRQA